MSQSYIYRFFRNLKLIGLHPENKFIVKNVAQTFVEWYPLLAVKIKGSVINEALRKVKTISSN